MLEEAQKAGALVVQSRVTGVEVNAEGILVYSEGENFKAAAVWEHLVWMMALAESLSREPLISNRIS
jgi:hypothetical protein